MKRIFFVSFLIICIISLVSCDDLIKENSDGTKAVSFYLGSNAQTKSASLSTGDGVNAVPFSELTNHKIKLFCSDGTGYCNLPGATGDSYVDWPKGTVQLGYGKWTVYAQGFKDSTKFYENTVGVTFIVGSKGVSLDDGANWGSSVSISESYCGTGSAKIKVNSSLKVKDQAENVVSLGNENYADYQLKWYKTTVSTPTNLATARTVTELEASGTGFTEWIDPTTAIEVGSNTYVVVAIVDKTTPSTIFGSVSVKLENLSAGQVYTLGSGSSDYVQFGKYGVEFKEPEDSEEILPTPGCITFYSSQPFSIQSANWSNETKHYWNGTIEYSTDALGWTTWDGSPVSSGSGKILYFRGTGNSSVTGSAYEVNNYAMWKITGANVSCVGNLDSLLDYQTALNKGTPVMNQRCFKYMFYGNDALVHAPELPHTSSVPDYCYCDMFENCTNLVNAPELPATTLGIWCYYRMFYGCSSLESAPDLPASTLSEQCYQEMFDGCSSLEKAPNMQVDSVALKSCYYMFSGCTSLSDISGIHLNAQVLAESCYERMFSMCKAIETAIPLPAMTLAKNCYQYMFDRCTALVGVPELPATELCDNCYSGMFIGCTNIKLSRAKSSDYHLAYRIPSAGSSSFTGTVALSMFDGNGVTMISTPDLNTTYYLNNSCNLVYRKDYAIGDVGPAGGTVIYDCNADNDVINSSAGPDGLMSSSCGWRYIEIAPADIKLNVTDSNVRSVVASGPARSGIGFGLYRTSSSGKDLYVNGTTAYDVNCTTTEIGAGKLNTELLVSAMGDSAYTSYSGNEGTSAYYAAKAAMDYTYTNGNIVSDDWYLPSKDELNLIYLYAVAKPDSSFVFNVDDSFYWSSSELANESTAQSAWYQIFKNGEQSTFTGRTGRYIVRPIRYF